MSRIEQWIAVVIGVFAVAGSVGGVTFWYVSNEVPKLIQTELDAREQKAHENKPDEIVAALAGLQTAVDGLATEQTQMKAEINANFEFLIEKIMEL